MKPFIKYLSKITAIAVTIVSIASCSSNSSKNDEEKKQPEAHDKKITELTQEQFNTVGIAVGTIEQKNLRSVVKASGYLNVPPQNQASVSTFMGAIVKSIAVLEGNFVKKGQVLATLEHPNFIKLQEEYVTAESNLELVEKEYLRQKELFGQNVSSGKLFQKAESEYNIAKAKRTSLENQLSLLSVSPGEVAKGNFASVIVLKSPIDGYIGKIKVTIGMYAETNQVLFEIIDNSKVHCDLLVYEKDLFKVKVGQKVSFILANLPEHQDNNNQTIDGEIFGINKSFEKDTKALTVHAEIKNEKHELIPGMYVNALIDIGEQKSMVVPVDAVVKSDGKEYVFIVDEMHDKLEHDHKAGEDKATKEETGDVYAFRMAEVVTGVSDLGYIEIKPVDEISPDAKVVIKNPFFILSKAKEGEGGEE